MFRTNRRRKLEAHYGTAKHRKFIVYQEVAGKFICMLNKYVKYIESAYFTMGPNDQNQHFAELRQKSCVYINALVLLRGLPSSEDKNELFVGKKRKKRLARLKSDRL